MHQIGTDKYNFLEGPFFKGWIIRVTFGLNLPCGLRRDTITINRWQILTSDTSTT
jgi:hypothetical protein